MENAKEHNNSLLLVIQVLCDPACILKVKCNRNKAGKGEARAHCSLNLHFQWWAVVFLDPSRVELGSQIRSDLIRAAEDLLQDHPMAIFLT